MEQAKEEVGLAAVEEPFGIDQALEFCVARSRAEGMTLEETLDALGRASFCFVCLLLSIPFFQPVPLGPYTMASGLTFIAAGWQMSRGHCRPVLPKAVNGMRIHGKGWTGLLQVCGGLLRFCRKFTKPRLSGWVTGSAGERLVGWLIFSGGILLAMPVANLPLNNFFPALMIASAAIAWLEKDGLLAILSLVWGAFSILYFAAVGIALLLFGSAVWEWMRAATPWF